MQSQNGIPEIAQGWPERIQQNLIRKCVIVPAIRGNHFQSSFQRSLNEYKHLKQAGKHLSGLATHLWRCFWKHRTKHIKVQYINLLWYTFKRASTTRLTHDICFSDHYNTCWHPMQKLCAELRSCTVVTTKAKEIPVGPGDLKSET